MLNCQVQVPGKVMIGGEYAVLNGGAALAATVDAHMQISIEPTNDDLVEIHSDLWPKPFAQKRRDITDVHTRDPLVDAVAQGLTLFDLPGMKVSISSQLNPAFGIGSSSALRLGVLLGMQKIAAHLQSNQQRSTEDCLRLSYELQKQAQGLASGYDALTQYCGGLVRSRPLAADTEWPGEVDSLRGGATALAGVVTVFVGGRGAPTSATTAPTMQWLQREQRMPALRAASEQMIDVLLQHLANASSWNELIQAVHQHRKLLSDGPHFPRVLAAKLSSIDGFDTTWTFKPTGAGGEDAMLVFAQPEILSTVVIPAMQTFGWQPASFKFCETGTYCQMEAVNS